MSASGFGLHLPHGLAHLSAGTLLAAVLCSCGEAANLPQRAVGKGRQQASANGTQDASEDEYGKAVRTACTARRYGLRLASSRKVAQGGDEAVPAIRAWLDEAGMDSIPVSLVDQIAVAEATGPALVELLSQWADTLDFYWRAQAMRALANRVRALPTGSPAPDYLLAQADRFRKGIQDPSWLTKVEGARGLHGLLRIDSAIEPNQGAKDRATIQGLLTDPDPRVRVEIAGALLEHQQLEGLGVLLAAARDRRMFLGDPWGPRMAERAANYLAAWTGIGVKRGRDRSNYGELMRQWRRAAEVALAPKPIPEVTLATFPPPADVDGGVEVRSCRHGDMFIRWNNGDEICIGLEPTKWIQLKPDAVRMLRERLRPQVGEGVHGPVVCDYLRLRALTGEGSPGTPEAGEVHRRIAPEHAPEPVYGWLQRLADALADAGHHGEAGRLRTRLEQFAKPD